MKGKKGFTLVELLVVIGLIALIQLIVIPGIMQTSKSMKLRQYETKKEMIISAAEVYAKNNLSSFGESSLIYVPVKTLVYYGYLEADTSNENDKCDDVVGCIINPVDGQSINDEIITIEKNKSVVNVEWGEQINKKLLSANFDRNGADAIGASKISCEAKEINGGILPCEDEITLPIIIREGYEILGWNENANSEVATYNVGTKVRIASDKTYYAITKKTVTVTFDANEGEFLTANAPASCVKYNKLNSCSISAIPNVGREGYVLSGWYDKKSGGEKINFAEVEDIVTAYARWTQCGAGTYAVAGDASCRVCPVGTYSLAGAGTCTICGIGKTSVAGSTSASACTTCLNEAHVTSWETPTFDKETGLATGVCIINDCEENYIVNNTRTTCMVAYPTVVATKSNTGTTAGVTVTFSCTNAVDCPNTVTGLKQTTTYTVHSESGLTDSVTVEVIPQIQKSTRNCESVCDIVETCCSKRCSRCVTGTPCRSAALGEIEFYCCPGASYKCGCKKSHESCGSYGSWSNVSSCTSSNTVECQTLYN